MRGKVARIICVLAIVGVVSTGSASANNGTPATTAAKTTCKAIPAKRRARLVKRVASQLGLIDTLVASLQRSNSTGANAQQIATLTTAAAGIRGLEARVASGCFSRSTLRDEAQLARLGDPRLRAAEAALVLRYDRLTGRQLSVESMLENLPAGSSARALLSGVEAALAGTASNIRNAAGLQPGTGPSARASFRATRKLLNAAAKQLRHAVHAPRGVPRPPKAHSTPKKSSARTPATKTAP